VQANQTIERVLVESEYDVTFKEFVLHSFNGADLKNLIDKMRTLDMLVAYAEIDHESTEGVAMTMAIPQILNAPCGRKKASRSCGDGIPYPNGNLNGMTAATPAHILQHDNVIIMLKQFAMRVCNQHIFSNTSPVLIPVYTAPDSFVDIVSHNKPSAHYHLSQGLSFYCAAPVFQSISSP